VARNHDLGDVRQLRGAQFLSYGERVLHNGLTVVFNREQLDVCIGQQTARAQIVERGRLERSGHLGDEAVPAYDDLGRPVRACLHLLEGPHGAAHCICCRHVLLFREIGTLASLAHGSMGAE
jgi:hypothetical protein